MNKARNFSQLLPSTDVARSHTPNLLKSSSLSSPFFVVFLYFRSTAEWPPLRSLSRRARWRSRTGAVEQLRAGPPRRGAICFFRLRRRRLRHLPVLCPVARRPLFFLSHPFALSLVLTCVSTLPLTTPSSLGPRPASRGPRPRSGRLVRSAGKERKLTDKKRERRRSTSFFLLRMAFLLFSLIAGAHPPFSDPNSHLLIAHAWDSSSL